MSKHEEILGFNDKWARIIGVPIVAFFTPIIFLNERFQEGLVIYLISFVVSLFYTLILWEGNRRLMIIGRNYFKGVGQENKRMIWQGAATLMFGTVTFLTLDPIVCYYLKNAPNETYSNMIGGLSASLFNSLLVITTYEAIYFMKRYMRSVAETEQLKREMVQSQLETLKNQVNPHFLFNSLNTLVSIIPDDKEVAVEFVRKLSKVYRYILEIKDRELITLSEELDFLNSYIFLQKIRFGDNLVIKLSLPEHLIEHQVVPLSLQMLLENAMKHNIVSTEKPLHIEISVGKDDQTIVVRNNLQLKHQVMDSTGTGLKNISHRYLFASGREVETIVSTSAFMVALPLINKAVTA